MNHAEITCMAKRRAEALLWTDTGENMKRQVYARGLCQNFNWTRPDEAEKRAAILQDTYINSNLTLVDDHEILIGNGVLIALM